MDEEERLTCGFGCVADAQSILHIVHATAEGIGDVVAHIGEEAAQCRAEQGQHNHHPHPSHTHARLLVLLENVRVLRQTP